MRDEGGVTAYIGLGANLGEPAAQLRAALALIDEQEAIALRQHSNFYRSAALLSADNDDEQDDYCNAVAEIRTQLSAVDLLASLQRIEQQMGRDRNVARWSARCIDLDLLLYGDATIQLPDLIVPHPEMHKRNFVIVPLQEIVVAAAIPNVGSLQELAVQLGSVGLEKWRQDA